MGHPAIVAVSGFTSEVGKTTLMCELLRAFPGWEAIKITRGHYRSCGKDPHACCVSHLLSDQPVIRSGRPLTYTAGKDTGRYWDAGAANVHWVIVTDDQVQQGIKEALKRVKAPGVVVEGNSFLDFIPVDFAIMVATKNGKKIKASARRALSHASALYLTNVKDERQKDNGFVSWSKSSGIDKLIEDIPIYTTNTLPALIAKMRAIKSLRYASAKPVGQLSTRSVRETNATWPTFGEE